MSRNSSITVAEEELSRNAGQNTERSPCWSETGEQRELRLRYAVKYPMGRSLTIE